MSEDNKEEGLTRIYDFERYICHREMTRKCYRSWAY